jgi:CRISPR/Cas system Type II protein with McrA/HNH and RuvC-like nuclease domain
MQPVSYLELFFAQNGRCFYCGGLMSSFRSNSPTTIGWTVDHFYPKSRGYTKHNNKVLCHFWCNSEKGDRMPTDEEWERFDALIGRIQARRERIKKAEIRRKKKED